MIADLSNVKMHMHMMICIRLSVTIVSYDCQLQILSLLFFSLETVDMFTQRVISRVEDLCEIGS